VINFAFLDQNVWTRTRLADATVEVHYWIITDPFADNLYRPIVNLHNQHRFWP